MGWRRPSPAGTAACRRRSRRQHRQLADRRRRNDALSGAGGGALLSVGDPHVSQGDGEVSGTALECSLDGLLELTVRTISDSTYPVLETATSWSVHGFGNDLDEAMRAAHCGCSICWASVRPVAGRRVLVVERCLRLLGHPGRRRPAGSARLRREALFVGR